MVQLTMKNPQNTVKTKPVHDENYWFMMLLYFASFLVGLGIIAIIAANWQNIPDNIKLIGALAVMTLNAGILSWTVKNNKNILKQVIACIFAFLIMAVIGLIGQIYHLSSDVENALLLWSLCSWPLLLAAPRLLWLWLPLFYGGIRCFSNDFLGDFSFSFVTDALFESTDFSLQYNSIWLNLLRICCVLGLFAAYELWVIKDKSQNKTVLRPLFFYSGWLMYLVYVNTVRIAHITAFTLNPNPKIAVVLFLTYLLPCLFAGAALYWYNRKNQRQSFMPMFLGAVLVEFILVYTIVRAGMQQGYHTHIFSNFSYEQLSPLVFLWITMRYTIVRQAKPIYRYLSYIGLALWFIIVFSENMYYIVPSLILCAFAAWMAYRANSKKWFNVAIIAAVLRILAYYADVSDLLHAGIYLTGSGILLIAVILLLMKYGKLLWEKNNEK